MTSAPETPTFNIDDNFCKISYLYQVITILVRMELKDTYVHKGLRMQLVQQLKDKGVDDKKVLSAIAQNSTPPFMDKLFLKYAYQDKAFPISCDQTISQPLTVQYKQRYSM